MVLTVLTGGGDEDRWVGSGVGGRFGGSLPLGAAPGSFQLVFRSTRPPARWSLSRLWIAQVKRHWARRARLVPLHPTATEALRRYASVRDRRCRTPRSRAFFLSSAGTPVLAVSLRSTFREIMTRIGVRAERMHPRIHDLRHRFAVQTLSPTLAS